VGGGKCPGKKAGIKTKKRGIIWKKKRNFFWGGGVMISGGGGGPAPEKKKDTVNRDQKSFRDREVKETFGR